MSKHKTAPPVTDIDDIMSQFEGSHENDAPEDSAPMEAVGVAVDPAAPDGDITTAPTASSDVLAEATNLLLSALVPHVKDAIIFHASCLKIPAWKLVLGVLNMAQASSLLSTPLLDPAWNAVNPIMEPLAKCKECGKTFKPKRRGQPFCSTECGAKRDNEEFASRLESNRKARIKANVEALGEPL